MSTLWTPDGERPVAPSDRSDEEDEAPIDEATARQALQELAELEAELLSVPAEAVIANHCYGLFELGAMHLRQQPPSLDSARLAIDALGGIVDNLGDRLGDATDTLRDGLASLRLAYVQIAAAAHADEVNAPPESG